MVTMTMSAGVLLKAGSNVSNDMYAGANGKTGKAILDEYIEQAEATINTITRYDWVTNWASIGANYQKILTDVCEAMAAMRAIQYDMGGYSQLQEAQTMLDVLKDIERRGLELLRLNEIQEIIV